MIKKNDIFILKEISCLISSNISSPISYLFLSLEMWYKEDEEVQFQHKTQNEMVSCETDIWWSWDGKLWDDEMRSNNDDKKKRRYGLPTPR